MAGNAKMWDFVQGNGSQIINHCQIINNGTCGTDSASDRGDSETCTVRAVVPLVANTLEFQLNAYFDFVKIGSTRYTGEIGPSCKLVFGDLTLGL